MELAHWAAAHEDRNSKSEVNLVFVQPKKEEENTNNKYSTEQLLINHH